MKIISCENCTNSDNIVEISIGKETYAVKWSDIAGDDDFERRSTSLVNVRVNKKICTLLLGTFKEKSPTLIVYDLSRKRLLYSKKHPKIIDAVCINETVAALELSNGSTFGEAALSLCAVNINTGEQQSTELFADSVVSDAYDYILEVRNNLLCIGIPGRRYFTSIESPEKMLSGIAYANYDDWFRQDLSIRVLPMPDSIYFSVNAEYLPSNTSGNINCGSCPEYVAGYLKYVVLGSFVYKIILSDRAYRKISLMYDKLRAAMPDIDIVMAMCAKKDRAKAKIGTKFKKAAALCENVFSAKRCRCAEALSRAADYINRLLKEYGGSERQYEPPIQIFFGAAEAKDKILTAAKAVSDRQRLQKILEKTQWTKDDSEYVLSKISLLK